MSAWLLGVLIAADQLMNAILGGLPDETICSRCWKAKLRGSRWAAHLVRLIDLMFGRGHCERCVEWDEV